MHTFQRIWLVESYVTRNSSSMFDITMDNVATMHKLLVSSHTQRKYHRVIFLAWILNLLLLSYRPPPSLQINNVLKLHCNGDILALLERWIILSMTRVWQRTDLVSHFAWGLVACWAGLLIRMVLNAVHLRLGVPCVYDHPCLCTWHCNYDQSWTFWTCSRAHLLCVDRWIMERD